MLVSGLSKELSAAKLRGRLSKCGPISLIVHPSVEVFVLFYFNLFLYYLSCYYSFYFILFFCFEIVLPIYITIAIMNLYLRAKSTAVYSAARVVFASPEAAALAISQVIQLFQFRSFEYNQLDRTKYQGSNVRLVPLDDSKAST